MPEQSSRPSIHHHTDRCLNELVISILPQSKARSKGTQSTAFYAGRTCLKGGKKEIERKPLITPLHKQ